MLKHRGTLAAAACMLCGCVEVLAFQTPQVIARLPTLQSVRRQRVRVRLTAPDTPARLPSLRARIAMRAQGVLGAGSKVQTAALRSCVPARAGRKPAFACRAALDEVSSARRQVCASVPPCRHAQIRAGRKLRVSLHIARVASHPQCRCWRPLFSRRAPWWWRVPSGQPRAITPGSS